MNDNAVKGSHPESSTWSSKPNKKSKKKRRRNKHKLYNLRLKKHKRKSSLTKNLLKPPPERRNRNVMSNWYWSNYRKALEWRDKHELAHWKACALALQEENRYLLQIINEMRPGTSPNVSVMWENFQKKRSQRVFNTSASSVVTSADAMEDCDEEDGDDDDDDDVEFEMSEEMMQFFKESIKHKENLKRLKEEESAKKVEEEVKQLQTNRLKRSAEMQLLYGEGASMITGMETAVQLSYEKFCDMKSPKYWPNIPFRL